MKQVSNVFHPSAIIFGLALSGLSCATPVSQENRMIPPSSGKGHAALIHPIDDKSSAKPDQPTSDQAEAFMKRAEKELLAAWIREERAMWIRATYITHDTGVIEAQAREAKMEATSRLSKRAVRFSGLELDAATARKLKLLKISLDLPAPDDAGKRSELARLVTEIKGMYGKGKYCPGKGTRVKRGRKQTCLDLGQLSARIAKSRSYEELLEVWKGWRQVSPPMRAKFSRYVELGNEGARSLGFADLGALWKSRFDMPAAAFEREIDRLWGQVKPLYEQLHCYARAKLRDRYGKSKVPERGPIPAHLLGNMWAQDWAHIGELLQPRKRRGIDLTRALKRKRVDSRGLVRYAERFFVSLGMAPLPASFWKRSMFDKPADREVVCHASAWDIDADKDLRIKMCIKVAGEDFHVIHHELGHIYYYYYYRQLPYLFRDSANKGFHEGLGDTISLSMTPSYLQKIGLIKRAPRGEIAALMARALDKVTFLPFGLLMDKWRWDVFSGKIGPDGYNAHWWKLRRKYQGIAPPVARGAKDFDPGAKYHIAANVPYVRYFLAHVLQFQFHRSLCQLAGHKGPLHTCSIYGNKKVGKRLMAMMKLGLSRPWPDALETFTGSRQMDATALLAYFKPLHEWLKKQNAGRTCGW